MSAGLGKRGRAEALAQRFLSPFARSPFLPSFPLPFLPSSPFALSQFWGLDYLGALNSLWV